MRTKILGIVVPALVILLVLMGIAGLNTCSAPTPVRVIAPAIVPGLATERLREAVRLEVIPRRIAEKALRVALPETQVLTAAVETPASKSGLRVLSITDTETGRTEIQYTEKPQDWLEWQGGGRVGGGIGFSTRHGRGYTAFAEYTPLRIGAVHIGAVGRADVFDSGQAEAYSGVQLFMAF